MERENFTYSQGVRLKKKKKGPQECRCLLYEQLTAEDMGNGSKNRTEWAECAPPPPQVWEGGGGRGQELQRGEVLPTWLPAVNWYCSELQ